MLSSVLQPFKSCHVYGQSCLFAADANEIGFSLIYRMVVFPFGILNSYVFLSLCFVDSRNIEENLQGNVDSSQIPNLFGNHGNANNANPANANNTNNSSSRVNNHSGQMPPLQVPKKSMLPQMGPPQDAVAMGPLPTKMSPQHQNPNDMNPSANGSTGRKYQCKMCPQGAQAHGPDIDMLIFGVHQQHNRVNAEKPLEK
ncbi:hypothetical protein AVEN_205089-1 [Araneus ventricosus]|uniref:Uncharacterized protein n=1 Tax=Araneus ventricosus TaxID=182803 RepID=A0A4Y2V1K5_ARAVE|nr:hypothetical protein AVEN_205089-1 [Araneus ventricosus]